MKTNLDAPITDLEGNPITEGEKQVTLSTICVRALLTENPNEQTSGEEKYRRYQLATTIHKGGEADLTAEDLVLIKKLVAPNFTPLVVGRVYDLLPA